jgi:GNAT superfamily N-acetyltransferase
MRKAMISVPEVREDASPLATVMPPASSTGLETNRDFFRNSFSELLTSYFLLLTFLSMSFPFRDIREARRARPDEAAWIAETLAEGFFASAEECARHLAETEKIVYVAAPLGEPAVGVVAAEPAGPEECRVPLLRVLPERRREGWGSRLAERAIVWARRRGARRVIFSPSRDSSASFFALKQGWRLTPDGWVADLDATE